MGVGREGPEAPVADVAEEGLELVEAEGVVVGVEELGEGGEDGRRVPAAHRPHPVLYRPVVLSKVLFLD